VKIIETLAFLEKTGAHLGTQPGFATPSAGGGLLREVLAPGGNDSIKNIEQMWGKDKKKKKKRRPWYIEENKLPEVSY
tara:strand:+ start:2980 stop:3213 length:234 start_codon:yes stop_codon:yes gene_type:complete